jgi:hypothetical protein
MLHVERKRQKRQPSHKETPKTKRECGPNCKYTEAGCVSTDYIQVEISSFHKGKSINPVRETPPRISHA